VHNKELADLHITNVAVIRLKKIRWAGYVTCMKMQKA
jgi:hypothetical protein